MKLVLPYSPTFRQSRLHGHVRYSGIAIMEEAEAGSDGAEMELPKLGRSSHQGGGATELQSQRTHLPGGTTLRPQMWHCGTGISKPLLLPVASNQVACLDDRGSRSALEPPPELTRRWGGKKKPTTDWDRSGTGM